MGTGGVGQSPVVLDVVTFGSLIGPIRETSAKYPCRWLHGKANLRATTRGSCTQTFSSLDIGPGIGRIELTDLRPEDANALFEAMREVDRPEAAEKPRRHSEGSRSLSSLPDERAHDTLMSKLNLAVGVRGANLLGRA